jgi:hypothetical protein
LRPDLEPVVAAELDERLKLAVAHGESVKEEATEFLVGLSSVTVDNWDAASRHKRHLFMQHLPCRTYVSIARLLNGFS